MNYCLRKILMSAITSTLGIVVLCNLASAQSLDPFAPQSMCSQWWKPKVVFPDTTSCPIFRFTLTVVCEDQWACDEAVSELNNDWILQDRLRTDFELKCRDLCSDSGCEVGGSIPDVEFEDCRGEAPMYYSQYTAYLCACDEKQEVDPENTPQRQEPANINTAG